MMSVSRVSSGSNSRENPKRKLDPGADLARHHARLHGIAAPRLQTAETLETVEIVQFVAARRVGIVLFAGDRGSGAHQRNAADADHVASFEGFGQGGFHGFENRAGALPSHRALVGGRRSAALSPAAHARDVESAEARNADAAAGAPRAAGVSAAGPATRAAAGISAAGAAAGVSAAGASCQCRRGFVVVVGRFPWSVLRLDRFGPRRFGDQAVDLLVGPVGGRLLVPKVRRWPAPSGRRAAIPAPASRNRRRRDRRHSRSADMVYPQDHGRTRTTRAFRPVTSVSLYRSFARERPSAPSS